jgi:hypothetical protein
MTLRHDTPDGLGVVARFLGNEEKRGMGSCLGKQLQDARESYGVGHAVIRRTGKAVSLEMASHRVHVD